MRVCLPSLSHAHVGALSEAVLPLGIVIGVLVGPREVFKRHAHATPSVLWSYRHSKAGESEHQMANGAFAARRPAVMEKRMPVYLAFAKVGGGWQKIGAAWKARSGDDVYSLQLTALPLNWDGRFILAMPDDGQEPNVPGDE